MFKHTPILRELVEAGQYWLCPLHPLDLKSSVGCAETSVWIGYIGFDPIAELSKITSPVGAGNVDS